MLFNSIEFAVFIPVVFVLYWFVFNRNLKAQNFLLLAASYLFYGWWDWRFLILIALSSIVDFLISIQLEKTKEGQKRKIFLGISLLLNLGLLGLFKYYNFFVESFIEGFTILGTKPHLTTLKIILPVGISFYTFQTLSYTIDVYKNKLKPTKDLVGFLTFVSFFPQLVAGPIERASNLLPQFFKKREFDYSKATDGMRQILWGLFKKVVIADNCAVYANQIFNNYTEYSGSTLLLGAIFFAFQIYGDFSGYSDIAIGTSRLFGFSLMQNFAFPYFSRDIAEFWRRWHISLSTWFRDYLYIPLGGSKGGLGSKVRNTFVIFLVSGFWHGANWTFVVWGALNALYFLPLLLFNKNRNNLGNAAEGRVLPSIKESFQISITFLLTVVAWVFFRSESLTTAFLYLDGIFSFSFFSIPTVFPPKVLILLAVFIGIEWLQRNKEHALQLEDSQIPAVFKWGVYYVLTFVIFWFGASQQSFIYFQF